MAKKSQVVRTARPAKYRTRQLNRCQLCGRSRAFMRQFGLCRICFRNLASQAKIPGVRKASW